MPQVIQAQNIAGINSIRVETDGAGTVTGIAVGVEVNYGMFGQNSILDLWPSLTSAERGALQALYTKALAVAATKYLA